MSGTTATVIKYSRVKSNVLAPVSRDPVLQHMSAWHIRQHELRVRSARPWEQAHVNPGRRRKVSNNDSQDSISNLNITNTENLRRSNKRHSSSCTRPTSGSTQSRQGVKTIRNTPPAPEPQYTKWQAHAASHAKQTVQDNQTFFKPCILETSAMSKLRYSRHYQQPRTRKHTSHPISGHNKAASDECAEVGKAWVVPSSCSSSSSGDSAYEAGGSSPPSRGSTPRHSCPQSRPSSQSRKSSGSASCISEVSHPSIKESQSGVNVREPTTQSLHPEVSNSPFPWEPHSSLNNEIPDTTFTPIKPLSRNDDLEYAMFEHDLMNEIVSAGLLTNSAVKQACRAHMAAYQGCLQQDKMEEIISRLHKLLDVPSDDSFDLSCYGLGNSSEFKSSKELVNFALADEWASLRKSIEEEESAPQQLPQVEETGDNQSVVASNQAEILETQTEGYD